MQGLVALVGRFLGSLGRLQDIRGWRYQKLILFRFHLNFFDTKGLAARTLPKQFTLVKVRLGLYGNFQEICS